jgi:hypothetical protein
MPHPRRQGTWRRTYSNFHVPESTSRANLWTHLDFAMRRRATLHMQVCKTLLTFRSPQKLQSSLQASASSFEEFPTPLASEYPGILACDVGEETKRYLSNQKKRRDCQARNEEPMISKYITRTVRTLIAEAFVPIRVPHHLSLTLSFANSSP